MYLEKRRILALVVALMMVFTLGACGAKEEPVVEQPVVETVSVEDAVTAMFAELPAMITPPADYMALLTAGETPFTIDIRTAEDYALGHVAGSVNAPWGTPTLSENLANIPMDQPVYIYCYTGQTAGQTVALMRIAGYEAYSVQYGFKLGISKAEGADAYISTEAASFDPSVGTEIAPEFVSMIADYFSDLATATHANNKITSEELNALIKAEDDSIFVLSVRKAEDYAKGHIPTAVNIPYAAGMQGSFADLPKDKTIVVYCYSGQTAGVVTAGLRMLGYDAVSLHSGFGTPVTAPSGWSNEGFEVVL